MGKGKASLGFMYKVPPASKENTFSSRSGAGGGGLKSGKKLDEAFVPSVDGDGGGGDDGVDYDSNDDESTRAFKRMLAGHDEEETNTSTLATNSTISSVSEADLKKKRKEDDSSMSALEKEVGRKFSQGPATTYADTVEKFPELKDAPMAKGIDKDAGVNIRFNPLGKNLRTNACCKKCGVWGHSMGDRECGVGGWNPFGGGRGRLSSAMGEGGVTEREVGGGVGEKGKVGEEKSRSGVKCSYRERARIF